MTDIVPQAITCSECHVEIIAEFQDEYATITAYEFGPYLKNKKVIHRHACDAKTKARVLERVAAEKRPLIDRDPNDWIYRNG
jgi:hypothetical protein